MIEQTRRNPVSGKVEPLGPYAEPSDEDVARDKGRSKAWWEGYKCQYPKNHNPYTQDQSEQYEDWIEGWLCRYYGEQP